MAYPNTIYDKPSALLAALGGFWANLYSGRDQVSSYVRAKAGVESQSMLDVLELIAAMSRYTVPLYHKDNWYELRLLASERNDAQTSLLKYDAGAAYDEPYFYDVPIVSKFHAFPLPPRLVDAPLILNRFISPSLTWTKNIDYLVDQAGAALVFRENPFDDARIAVRPVYDAGVVTDREAVLWIFRGDFDWETAYRQFGYVLGLRMASSAGYRELLNAVFDAIVGGTARRQVELAFAAMTGVPLVREATEIVERIERARECRLIITDQHVYKFDPEATPSVAVGDTVHAGDTLTDALQFYEFNRGQLDDEIAAIAMGRGFLLNCYYGDLVFENKEVPLEVFPGDPSGFTKVSFSLGGFPLDVDRFFDDLHARGVAEASRPIDPCETVETLRVPGDGCETEDRHYRRGTLAHLLDERSVRDTEPVASNLPAAINPLKFLVENVLRGNLFVVRIKAAYLGAGAVGLHNARILRKIVPPHTALLTIVELAAAADSVTVSRISETVEQFTAMERLQDTIEAVAVQEAHVSVRLISGTCQ